MNGGTTTNKRIILLLCIAENAIEPHAAFRNDDILTLYSGKTVEINNCDTGVVLGDGVSHASKHISNLDLVVDVATLTGTQQVTTGKRHGAVLGQHGGTRAPCRGCGDAVGRFGLPNAVRPELLQKEFESKVADMKNSVKDRKCAEFVCGTLYRVAPTQHF